jgi:hypothetical protein
VFTARYGLDLYIYYGLIVAVLVVPWLRSPASHRQGPSSIPGQSCEICGGHCGPETGFFSPSTSGVSDDAANDPYSSSFTPGLATFNPMEGHRILKNLPEGRSCVYVFRKCGGGGG